MAFDYYDAAVWVEENTRFSRIHARFVPGKEWQDVDVDDGIPQVDSEASTKPWVVDSGALFDDDDVTRVRMGTSRLLSEGPAYQTFRAYPVSAYHTPSVRHLLYVRLKAKIFYRDFGLSSGYFGYFRLEYVREDGTVITALNNTRDFDGYVRIAADVREVRLVAEGEQDGPSHSFVGIDFYIMRPYFVSPSRVYGKLADGRVVAFCQTHTFDVGNSMVGVQTSVGEQRLMTVPTGHPFGSGFKVCTSRGIMELVAYE